MTETQDPTFPPLLKGEEATQGTDPFEKAVSSALLGCDPGLVVWTRRVDALQAALVLTPECPLEEAVGVSFAASLGLGDALGALGPPEVAVHYVWPTGIKVNGANCGRLKAAASTTDPAQEPDWLVLGVEIPFLPAPDAEGGDTPDETCLMAEGCAEITPVRLLESWSRHTLVWINKWLDEGLAPLHAGWRERAWELGEDLPNGQGTFMGLDDRGGMLVKTAETTLVHPLSTMLEGRL